jgi:prepilin-type processing-associated H-X9-DG protein
VEGLEDPISQTVRYYFKARDGQLEHTNNWERLGYWHSDKANVVFLDGHVELVDGRDNKTGNGTVQVCTGNWPPE